MDVIISSRHVEPTDAIKEYARTKAERLVKYYDRIQEIEIILKCDADTHICELVVDVVHSRRLVAEATGRDLHAAIDAVMNKMERQLRKHKERIRPYRQHGHQGEPQQ